MIKVRVDYQYMKPYGFRNSKIVSQFRVVEATSVEIAVAQVKQMFLVNNKRLKIVITSAKEV